MWIVTEMQKLLTNTRGMLPQRNNLQLCPLNSDGRDLRDCTLPQDIKRFLGEVPDFSEELPGEDIFPMFHPYVTVSF